MANNSTSFVEVYSSHPICFLSVTNFDPYNPIRPDTVDPTWTVLATVNGITALPTAGINALIVWTVFSDEDLKSSPFNVLLGELAVTDMLVGLVVQPMTSGMLGCFINYCYSPCHFTVHAMTALVCSGTSVVTLALACAERYLSIEHPNLYRKVVTEERVKKVAVISWIATLVYLIGLTIFLNKYHPNLSKVPFMVLLVVCAVVILFCCSKVQMTAYRQQRTIGIQLQAPLDQNATQSEESDKQKAKRRKELKQVFTMTALVIMSVVSLTPFIIVAVIEVTAGLHVTSDFQYLAGPTCVTLINLQSLVNPAILALRLSYIRKGIKKKLSYLRGLIRC